MLTFISQHKNQYTNYVDAAIGVKSLLPFIAIFIIDFPGLIDIIVDHSKDIPFILSQVPFAKLYEKSKWTQGLTDMKNKIIQYARKQQKWLKNQLFNTISMYNDNNKLQIIPIKIYVDIFYNNIDNLMHIHELLTYMNALHSVDAPDTVVLDANISSAIKLQYLNTKDVSLSSKGENKALTTSTMAPGEANQKGMQLLPQGIDKKNTVGNSFGFKGTSTIHKKF